MNVSEKEDAEAAAMDLDAQLYDALSPLKSSIVQRDAEEFEEYASDVVEIANEILEIAESDSLDLWPRYIQIIMESIEDMREAFHDQEYEQAFELADQIRSLSLYELRQQELYEEENQTT